MNKSIPNILTTIRMAFVPLFILIFYFTPFKNSYTWATIIFIIAELTDYFDGFIARKYHIISNYGKIMDPLADKLLTGAAFICLALPPVYIIDWMIVVIILVREIFVSILREIYARKNIFIPANIMGKLKTFMQMTGLTAALLYISINGQENIIVSMIFYFYFWLVALVTIISGFSYIMPLLFPKSSEEDS
jgi:CDP-diacylglycerol--glycerol-3-phosphate 3-phosphatidyltransferase